MLKMLLAWLINAGTLFILPSIISSIHIQDFGTALIVAVLLALTNVLVRPILLILTLPITILTLGLFVFVLNALLFWGIADIVDGFSVGGFWSALAGTLIYSAVSWAVNSFLLASLAQKKPSN